MSGIAEFVERYERQRSHIQAETEYASRWRNIIGNDFDTLLHLLEDSAVLDPENTRRENFSASYDDFAQNRMNEAVEDFRMHLYYENRDRWRISKFDAVYNYWGRMFKPHNDQFISFSIAWPVQSFKPLIPLFSTDTERTIKLASGKKATTFGEQTDTPTCVDNSYFNGHYIGSGFFALAGSAMTVYSGLIAGMTGLALGYSVFGAVLAGLNALTGISAESSDWYRAQYYAETNYLQSFRKEYDAMKELLEVRFNELQVSQASSSDPSVSSEDSPS